MALEWGGSVSCRVLAGGMLACRVQARASKIELTVAEYCREGYTSPTKNNEYQKEAFYCIKYDTRVDGPWANTDPEPTYTLQFQRMHLRHHICNASLFPFHMASPNKTVSQTREFNSSLVNSQRMLDVED